MWPGFDRCGSRNGTNPSRQETLPEVEHISTIAGSLGSIGTLSQVSNEHSGVERFALPVCPCLRSSLILSTVYILVIADTCRDIQILFPGY